MVLDKETIKIINDFVKKRPRSIQEIADKIDKSWRTADRYVKKISEEEGTLGIHKFRGGTRGALKIVYWRTSDELKSSRHQERLWQKIRNGRTKVDFSPFDIFECVNKDKRNAFLEQQKEENVEANHDIIGTLREAKNSILIFSGNLSWSTLQQNGNKVRDVFKELAKKDINIKILSRVDITSMKNVELMQNINDEIKKERINIRHCEHPIRGIIIDDKLTQLKEMKDPSNYKDNEIDKKTYIFYEIYDEEWIEWLKNVFWKLYRNGIPAKSRLEDLNTIKNILKI